MEYLYGDLTHQIIGGFYHVHNTLGVGFDEKAYHNALASHFHKLGIPCQSKPRKAVRHRDQHVREFEADLIVYDKIILELKSIQSDFIQKNYVQIISQLKLWKLMLGILVNFGLQKVAYDRIPFTEKEKKVTENYDYINFRMNASERNTLNRLVKAILYIFEIHGLGYGEYIYRRMLSLELEHRKIDYRWRFPINVNFDSQIVSVYKMKPLLIEEEIICDIKALKDRIDFYDIAKIQSYLRALRLNIGIIANFGKTELEIRGVRA